MTLLDGFGSASDSVKGRAVAAPFVAGYLVCPAESGSPATGSQVVPYQPQPGDLILYDDFSKFHQICYKLACTEAPVHVAMVIAREDGKPALLELTGPIAITAKVCILDVESRMANYPGTVMVRRIRQPLTPEQSHELTCFAEQQVGKRFALGRIVLQITPLCPRTGLRKTLFGHTYLNRNRWFCSEMVVAAGTCAQVFDPQIHKANAIYPRDMAYDDTMDLSGLYHPLVSWVAERPPAPPAPGVR
jgi:hypothetical protein